MFQIPFPDNLYGIKGQTAVAIISNWTVNKGGITNGPAPMKVDKEADSKKPVYNVNVTVAIYFDEDAFTKKLQPLKTENKSLTFDSSPTEEALNREVELLYNPA